MDIFESLKIAVGCGYISDLRYDPYWSMANHWLAVHSLESYTFRELCDLAAYLHGRAHFESQEAVVRYLQSFKPFF